MEKIAAEISACVGELSSGVLADVEPERHSMANDREMSQRTRIAPCTRRMSERMTGMADGLSGLKKRNAHSSRKEAGSPREMRSEPVVFHLLGAAATLRPVGSAEAQSLSCSEPLVFAFRISKVLLSPCCWV